MDGCWLAGRREGANTNPVPVVERRRGEKGREGPSERAGRSEMEGGTVVADSTGGDSYWRTPNSKGGNNCRELGHLTSTVHSLYLPMPVTYTVREGACGWGE